MTDKTIDLDDHRGMAAQKATELRRLLANVEANEESSSPSTGRVGSAPDCSGPRPIGVKLPRRHATFSSFLPRPPPRKIPEDRNSLPRCCVTSSG